VSGLILVAIRKRAARLLSDQFASRKVSKVYHAWVQGRVHADVLGRWVDHVRKITDKAQTEIVSGDTEGAKVAETEASLLAYDSTGNRSLLELSPLTGRMHQLRIQTAHRGFPIIGDWQYGFGQTPETPKDGSESVKRGQLASETDAARPFADSGHEQTFLTSSPEGSSSDAVVKIAQGPERILLQAHQLTFHDPTTGALKTVTASDDAFERV